MKHLNRAGVGTVAVLLIISALTQLSAGAAPSAKQAVKEANAALKNYENPNPTLTITPLKSTPPTAKTITFLSCPISACEEAAQGVQDAADALGWTVNVINQGLQPSTILTAWNSAVQNPGNLVISVGLLPNSALTSQLASLKAAGVPVIEDASSSPIGDDMIANVAPPAEVGLSGKLIAEWIAANSNANAKVVLFTDPTYAGFTPLTDDLQAELKVLCPAHCSVNVQTINATGTESAIASQIVSFVQSNPSVKYLVMPNGDDTLGVPQALAAAGLSGKIKICTRDTQVNDIEGIKAGTEAMGVTAESYESGWRMVNIYLDYLEGMKFTPQPVGVLHVITKTDTPKDVHVPWTIPGYESKYEKAWGIN